MSELKLKCCPFCGGTARVVLDYQDNETWAQCTTRRPKRCPMSTTIIPIEEWNTRRAKPEPSEAVRDAERWMFRQQFLLDGGAVLWSQRGCQYRDVQGMIICQGRTEEDAIDAAIAAHHAKEKGND